MNKGLRKSSTLRFSFRRSYYKRRIDESSRGFTLVELLVVLATMAVLAITLIPAFASAKPNSLAFQCMNNLRQWGTALRTMASDNNDMMARDGTDSGGSYAAYTGAVTGPGSPNDPYAWFNVAPPAMGENPFSTYWNMPGGNPQLKLPFPGGQGKIWHCPAAKATSADTSLFLQGGTYGFFSYVMNIDLKLNSTIANGVIGNSAVYPNMPKFGAIRNPSAVVMLTDFCFSPALENWTGSSAPQNGCFPACRWTYFVKRHNQGGTIVFVDGHAAIFKWDYVFNSSPIGGSRQEKLNPDIWWNPNRDIP